MERSVTLITREWAHRFMFRHRFRVSLPGRISRGSSLEVDLIRLFERRNRPLSVIFDIGANVGQTAKQFANIFPATAIHSFEPVAATFDEMCANVRHLKNVTPHRLAIGSKGGKVLMEILEQSDWNRVAREDGRLAKGPVEECEMKTLQEVCAELNCAVDLLKIDVEGHEIEVLNGAKPLFEQGKIASVFAEVDFSRGGKHGSFFEINELLVGSYGFIFYALYDYSGWQGRPADLFCNGLWVHSSLWA